MNIHHKINHKDYNKGWIFKWINNKRVFHKEDINDFAMNYSIDLHNKKEQSKMINSGRYYCSDCSYSAGYSIHHYNYSPKFLKKILAKEYKLK